MTTTGRKYWECNPSLDAIALDLMTAGGLAVELEPELLEPPDNIPVLETGEPAHQVLTIKG